MKTPRIYTRRGDAGQTDLVGGVRVAKTNPRLEAYGTIDELSAHLGLLVALMPDGPERPFVQAIQHTLFGVGALLATDTAQPPFPVDDYLPTRQTARLEQAIDEAQQSLPAQPGFVLPGGHVAAAQAHVCRTVCRRAERRIAALARQAHVPPEVQQYVNRLSDYLFVLAKKVNFNTATAEIIWQKSCE